MLQRGYHMDLVHRTSLEHFVLSDYDGTLGQKHLVAELERRANFAALYKVCMQLEDRIDFLCSGTLFAVEHTATRRVNHPRAEATIRCRRGCFRSSTQWAGAWPPETVTYQAELITHDGALWQAQRDTAQQPGGSAWICVAASGRAGSDEITPTVRGTCDAREQYQQLDIVAQEGGSFIARKNNPGPAPVMIGRCCANRARPVTTGNRTQGSTRREGRARRGRRDDRFLAIRREKFRMSPLMNNGTVGPAQ